MRFQGMKFKALGLSGFLLGSAIAAQAETIYVTSIEHFETVSAIGYKVAGYTTDTEPKIQYRLACGVNAVRLQTGRSYIVIPLYDPNGRYLEFTDVQGTDKDPKSHMLCDIESEQIAK